MKVLKPITITEGMLTSSTLTEADHAAWNSGTTYALADRVIKAHKIWEAAQGSNTNHDPETDTAHTWWLEVGPTNRWAMFDGAVSTASESADDIAVVITPGVVINGVAVVAAVGDQVRVRMLDGATEVFNETQSLDSTPISDWDEYFFADQVLAGELIFDGLPRYLTASVEVLIEKAPSGAAVGVVALGTVHDIGSSAAAASAGISDYSRKETDDFGTVALVQRSYAKRSSQRLVIDTADLRRVQALLSSLRAVPCVWIGADDTSRFSPLVVFGWFKAFGLDIPGPVKSYCTLEIEGLI